MGRMRKIAVIAGDGIGVEVTKAALEVLRAALTRHNLRFDIEELDYGAERYLRDGTTMPAGEIERFRRDIDAVFLGAVGDPRIPDMRHARDILLAMRFELDLYVNFRPVRCMTDALSPLKRKTARDIDFVVFRENTEGAYVSMGGIFKKGTLDEVAINDDVNTRKGVERIIRAAFAYAKANGRRRVCMSDKSNALRFAHDIWQRVFKEVRDEYPDIEARHLLVDALAMELVRAPDAFDVIVTNNMFGDIITDLGAALQGGMGMASSANINPSEAMRRETRPNGFGLFEPVHGSAPDIAGKGVANPLAAVGTIQLMLEHLGFPAVARDVGAAMRQVVEAGNLTPDVGGTSGTAAVRDRILTALAETSV
jgi:3-isopropylmalate dehydrogenase